MAKGLRLLQVIGSILMFSGIFASIVMNQVVGDQVDIQLIDTHRQFVSAMTYALTIPGMWLAILATVAMFFISKTSPFGNVWYALMVILMLLMTINASFLLMPLVDQVSQLARKSLETGVLAENYASLKLKEDMFGAANFFMALITFIIGYFKPISKGK